MQGSSPAGRSEGDHDRHDEHDHEGLMTTTMSTTMADTITTTMALMTTTMGTTMAGMITTITEGTITPTS